MVQHAGAAGERRLTLANWVALPEEARGELVDGILVEEETPSFVHEVVVAWLIGVLRAWASSGARVPAGTSSRRAFVAGSGVKLGVAESRGRMADVVVYLRGEPGAPRPQARGLVDVPPSIAVEVLTPTPRDERRDRVEKLFEYARFGVRWYWLVDPELRTLEILELDPAGRYAHVLGAGDGIISTVPGCDGLSLDLPGLWAEVDAVLDESR